MQEVKVDIGDDLMLNALHADGPAADRAEGMMLYGQFVGSWEGQIRTKSFQAVNAELRFDYDGPIREFSLEVHFGWALEGRAIQDVWISPMRKEVNDPTTFAMYGTTLRIYDPKNDCWYITFIDPFTTQSYHRMIGRKIGEDIVQEHRKEGLLTHWIFTDITDHSFHWMWKESTDNGKNWKVPSEFFLERRSR